MTSTITKINLLAMAGACLLALTACSQKNEVKQTAAPSETANETKLPKLLDLGAKSCIPCKKMAPILDELTEEYKGVFDVEFIDVWQPENQQRAQSYKIQSIPTQIFFDSEGRELWRHVGFISKEDLLKKWEELGYKFKPIKAQQNSPAVGSDGK